MYVASYMEFENATANLYIRDIDLVTYRFRPQRHHHLPLMETVVLYVMAFEDENSGRVSFTNPTHMEASRKDATFVSSEHLSETNGACCRWCESTPPSKGGDRR